MSILAEVCRNLLAGMSQSSAIKINTSEISLREVIFWSGEGKGWKLTIIGWVFKPPQSSDDPDEKLTIPKVFLWS